MKQKTNSLGFKKQKYSKRNILICFFLHCLKHFFPFTPSRNCQIIKKEIFDLIQALNLFCVVGPASNIAVPTKNDFIFIFLYYFTIKLFFFFLKEALLIQSFSSFTHLPFYGYNGHYFSNRVWIFLVRHAWSVFLEVSFYWVGKRKVVPVCGICLLKFIK